MIAIEKQFLSLADIDRLTSITATAGATLIFTYDGTNTKLTNSNGELILVIPGTLRINPSSGTVATTVKADTKMVLDGV